jgi:hypothetical protein
MIDMGNSLFSKEEGVVLELVKWHQIFQEKELEAYKAIRVLASSSSMESAHLQLERMMAFCELKQLLYEFLTSSEPNLGNRTYVAGSMFLHDCFSKLMRTDDEYMYYVTGPEIGSILLLDQIAEFDLESKSPVHADGNLASSHKQLIRLHLFGHKLHALVHCHPGKGIGASGPSLRDLETQERQEKGKYPVIGGIFTRDGFVRFYSVQNKFRVLVYGEGVEKVDEKTYCLTEISNVRS